MGNNEAEQWFSIEMVPPCVVGVLPMGDLLVLILAGSALVGLLAGLVLPIRIFVFMMILALPAPMAIAAKSTDPTALVFPLALSGFGWFCWAAALVAGLLALTLRADVRGAPQ